MSKLNVKLIQYAAPKKTEYRLPDGKGLFLRVRPSGSKSWLYCFRLLGSRELQQMTLGTLEDVPLKKARLELIELRKLVAEGKDPRNVRAAAKAKNSQAITMQQLFEDWIGYVKIAGEVTPLWAKRHEDRWRLHLKKPLSNILVRDVNRAHLANALDAMTRKGTREETRKALTTLNLMMDYGLTRHFIDSNPARMLKPKDFIATASRPRDRVLTLQELRKLWQALDEATAIQNRLSGQNSMSVVTTTAIKLLILTGARRGEVAGMKWAEISIESGTWSLPAERTKNRQAQIIYFSPLAIQLLLALKLHTSNSQFVFDTARKEVPSHIHEDTLTGALLRLRGAKGSKNFAPLKELKPFTVHDLRRSAATAWGEYLKVAPHVIEKMLNHQPLNKLVATYQHASYAHEQKAAWIAWGGMIEHQVAQRLENVIVLRNASCTR